jgi:hypothetical protein
MAQSNYGQSRNLLRAWMRVDFLEQSFILLEVGKKGSNVRSILDPIAVAGREPLLDFLGKSTYTMIY